MITYRLINISYVGNIIKLEDKCRNHCLITGASLQVTNCQERQSTTDLRSYT